MTQSVELKYVSINLGYLLEGTLRKRTYYLWHYSLYVCVAVLVMDESVIIACFVIMMYMKME